jgi:hypothetical protein
MVRLKQLPSAAMIDKLKGSLDFYVYHMNLYDEEGIPVCRTWPRYHAESYPESSRVMQPAFAYVNKMAPFISPIVHDAYVAMAGSTGLAWRDYMVRLYLNGELL